MAILLVEEAQLSVPLMNLIMWGDGLIYEQTPGLHKNERKHPRREGLFACTSNATCMAFFIHKIIS